MLKKLAMWLTALSDRWLDYCETPSSIMVVYRESDYGSPLGWVVEARGTKGQLFHRSKPFATVADANPYVIELTKAYNFAPDDYMMVGRQTGW